MENQFHGLNLDSYQYENQGKARTLQLLNSLKNIDKPIDRFKVLIGGKDKAGELIQKIFRCTFRLCFKQNSWNFRRAFTK